MLKLEIRLDYDRIIRDGKYEPDRIQSALDNSFMDCGFRKQILEDNTVCYWGNKQPEDYANFGGLITSLKTKPWFMKYVDKWLWYNSDGQIDENCYRIEDVLYHYTKQRSA